MDEITKQHLGWIKMYAETMTAENWLDMQLRIERQVEELADHLKNKTA